MPFTNPTNASASATRAKGEPLNASVVEEKLTARANVRLTVTELADLKEDAHIAGLTVSAYIRRRVLGRPVVANADQVAFRQVKRLDSRLRSLGGQLKDLHNKSRGAYSEKTAEMLKQISTCLKETLTCMEKLADDIQKSETEEGKE